MYPKPQIHKDGAKIQYFSRVGIEHGKQSGFDVLDGPVRCRCRQHLHLTLLAFIDRWRCIFTICHSQRVPHAAVLLMDCTTL